MGNAHKIGIALIAGVLALGLLLGRGGLGALLDDAWDGGGALAEAEWRASEATTPSLSLEEEAPEPLRTFGHLGEPPAPRGVYPHLQVGAPGEMRTKKHAFAFEGRDYTVNVAIDNALYEAAAAADHRMTEIPGESEAEMKIAYYRYLIQDPAQAPVIADVAAQLRAAAEKRKLDRDRYVELVAKYVQSMPYDFEKLAADDRQDRFPVETIMKGTGVCGDKSLLMAALLAHEGFDVALLLFSDEKHMAVGIAGPGAPYKESGYLFVETTNLTYVSEIPETFVSGIQLTSDPLVIPVGKGSRRYGAAAGVARIIRVRDAAHPAGEALVDDASSRLLTPAEAAAANSRLGLVNEAQFRLSAIDDHEDERLDRVQALAWIDKNCWWD